jgi:hypothetical protein
MIIINKIKGYDLKSHFFIILISYYRYINLNALFFQYQTLSTSQYLST